MSTVTLTLTTEQASTLLNILYKFLFNEILDRRSEPLPKNSRLRKSLETKPKAKSKEAPWGYKKDGTPRARPGRKVAA
jgi:hypothetical protein